MFKSGIDILIVFLLIACLVFVFSGNAKGAYGGGGGGSIYGGYTSSLLIDQCIEDKSASIYDGVCEEEQSKLMNVVKNGLSSLSLIEGGALSVYSGNITQESISNARENLEKIDDSGIMEMFRNITGEKDETVKKIVLPSSLPATGVNV